MKLERAETSIYENKISLLRMVTKEADNLITKYPIEMGPESTSTRLHAILQAEVLYAHTEQKTLDILEICPGEILGMVGILLGTQNFLAHNPDPDSRTEGTVFWEEYTKRARAFLDQFENLIHSGSPETVADFLSTNRKMIGFCIDVENLTRLGQILSNLYTEGLLDKDSITIAHYPGSFNPFPHVGHAEVAEQVKRSLLSAGIKNPRVVMSTITRSEEKSIEDNFSDRVDNLVRGFVDNEYVSVLGVPSDLTKQNEVIDFRQLVAKLDSQGKGRHVMGNDTLLSHIAKAREGDLLSSYLINTGNTIFLSIRGGDDHSAMSHAVNIVKNEFDCELVVLPPPKHQISGTIVRGLDIDARRQYSASIHVKINN
ncbi:MAG: hypothetical protein A2784_00910 [Candidatus Chisholmbacteria bacterium RIFCSPHIGHO2_01_FULL_48_12]|uniref:Uncharacterized protein n=1 Tax=Candidatus Chisholmbacteria bacterium RIFCSPHIGHO2_01_FULL_48_12 TaxID=1797589 RepID=A0A1G1VRJ8_9BACT|nr:MAG: hypothetical protein A2784_00910 [Candidatus Chisholmbacteria bacterium RIFCSPHIGHO2_01_FULL_48_12]